MKIIDKEIKKDYKVVEFRLSVLCHEKGYVFTAESDSDITAELLIPDGVFGSCLEHPWISTYTASDCYPLIPCWRKNRSWVRDHVHFNNVPLEVVKEIGVESWFERQKTALESLKNGGVTKIYKVYGREGHRQRESFCPSDKCDLSNDVKGVRKLTIYNSDKTGTNDYSIIEITRATAEMCSDELYGQVSDGIFENSAIGKIVEISRDELNGILGGKQK